MTARGKRVAAAVCAAVCAATCGGCNYYVVGDRDYSDATFGTARVDEASILADTKEFVYGNRGIALEDTAEVDADILDRTAFTSGTDGAPTRGERAAAARLTAMFASAGYAVRDAQSDAALLEDKPYVETLRFTQTVKQSTGVFSSTVREVTSQNVAAVIPATGESYGTIIVGTHYDNRYGSDLVEGSGGHGVYSGGFGVGALVTLAREAIKTPRPFTLKFVAFGAGEAGNLGSLAYVAAMTAAERKETLLMCNLDLMGGGDKLYLFCDDAETAHEDYLRAACADVSPSVRRPPKDKRIILANGSTETYTHYGWFGDNNSFYRAGISCAAFFGLDWDAKGVYGLVESATKKPVLGTADDTLIEVTKRYPDCAAKTAAAADVILAVLDAPAAELAEVMRYSRETRRSVEWLTSTRIQMYIYGGAVVVLGIAAAITAGILSKRKPRPEDVITVPQEDVFAESEARSGNDPFEGY